MSPSTADEAYQEKYGDPALTTPTTTPNPNITEPISLQKPPEWWDGNSWPMGVEDFQRDSLAEMYMASIYFALMTITTIGYGDITPVSESAWVQAIVGQSD